MTVAEYVKWAKDMCERMCKTYVQAALGLVIASPGLDISKIEACLVAAIPAALSVVSSMLSSRFGSKDSASLLS